MNFVSRADAPKKIREHLLATLSRDALLDNHTMAYDWPRMRNYEIERELEKWLGGEWCINEWRPFNGEYCRWQDYAPK